MSVPVVLAVAWAEYCLLVRRETGQSWARRPYFACESERAVMRVIECVEIASRC
jgi:hypothetical protein